MHRREASASKAMAAILSLAGAAVLLAAPSHAAGLREGQHDLFFGLGSLTSQEADISGSVTLDADDGTTFDVRYRYHFNATLGIEACFVGETERTHLKVGGFTTDSNDTDTTFFLINLLFNLTETPVAPYVTVGVGRFSHDGGDVIIPPFVVTIEEDGPVFDAAFGVDGRTDGRLIWAFEARLLHYEFEDFSENWNRYQFSGHLGVRF